MSDREFIMQMRPWIGEEERQAIDSYMQEDGFLTEFKNTKKFEDSIGAPTFAPMTGSDVYSRLASVAVAGIWSRGS